MPSPYGYYPTQQPLPGANYTDYSGYANPQYDPTYGTTSGGYSPEVAAAVAARNSSGMATRDVFGANGVTSDTRPLAPFNSNSNAPAFQGSFMDDPFYQRSDVAPFIQATNRDVLGNGKYGARGWMTDHPLGVIAAMVAAAAGGAALSGGAAAGGGAASGGSGVGMASGGGALSSDAALGAAADSSVGTFGASGLGAAGTGAGAAGAGFGGAGTAGLPANLAGDFAASSPYGGAAGQLAASGGIQGGAGAVGGPLGGSGFLATQGRGLLTNAGHNYLTGSGDQGSANSAPISIPMGMMGSTTQAAPMQAHNVPQLDQRITRFKGYGRTPVQFRGTTIWL